MTTQAVQCQCNCRHVSHPSLVSTPVPTPVSLSQAVSTPSTHASSTHAPSTHAPSTHAPSTPTSVPTSSQIESALQSISAQGKQSQLQSILTSTQVGYLTSYQSSHSQTDITNFINSLSPQQSQAIVSLASGSSTAPSALTTTTSYGTTPSGAAVTTTKTTPMTTTLMTTTTHPMTTTTTTTTKTTATSTNLCSQFSLPCQAPEPFASMIDIITAAQYLEKAIHDPTIPMMMSHLNRVTTNLSYARDYFQGIHDMTMVNRIQSVINAVEGFKSTANTLKKSQLTNFQKVTLYGFQGVIGALYQDVKNYSLPTSGSGY